MLTAASNSSKLVGFVDALDSMDALDVVTRVVTAPLAANCWPSKLPADAWGLLRSANRVRRPCGQPYAARKHVSSGAGQRFVILMRLRISTTAATMRMSPPIVWFPAMRTPTPMSVSRYGGPSSMPDLPAPPRGRRSIRLPAGSARLLDIWSPTYQEVLIPSSGGSQPVTVSSRSSRPCRGVRQRQSATRRPRLVSESDCEIVAGS